MALFSTVFIYIGALIVTPLSALVFAVFSNGAGPFFQTLTRPDVVHALALTLGIAFATVLVNSFFGMLVAWVLVRHEFPGKRLLNGLIDLPFAVSPVVVGLVLFLLFGKGGGGLGG